jgi:hypothetical protein
VSPTELLHRVGSLAGAARRRHTRASSVAVDAGPPDEHALAMLERALALGAPDPYILLDQVEASAILGVPLGPPQLICADTLIGVRCSATSPAGDLWSAEVAALHGDEDGFDAQLAWDRLVEGAGVDDVAVDGIGDLARIVEGAVHLRAGGCVAIVRVAAPDAGLAASCALALARPAAARLAADGSRRRS